MIDAFSNAAAANDDLAREVYCILGIPIDAVDTSTVLHKIDAAVAARLPFLISTPNLNFLVTSQTDPEFRESLLQSDLCPPDGMPIVWIARLLGIPIKTRIAGSDIFDALRSRPGREPPLKIFLFGSTERIAAAAAERLNSTSISLKCVGWACPGFVNLAELSEDRFINQINASGADFLVAALGAKKGQVWLRRNHSRLQIPIRSHLGATINFQAGAVKRAPLAMRKLGLEWLWRIKEEPSLFSRYWHDGMVFLGLLLTRVLPLAAAARWRQWRSDHGRHDFVIVPVNNEGSVTLRICGDATAAQVPQAISFFRDAIATLKPVVVDLSRTQAVDARFLGLLFMLRKQLTGNGSGLRFTGLAPELERQFRLNGLEYLLSSSDYDVDTIH